MVTFASEDEEAQHYLRFLREGSQEQKIEARDRLSRIFEDRGMLAEATELLEGNGRTGVRDRSLYTRLATLYRRQDRDDDADAAMAEAMRLTVPRPSSVKPPPLVENPTVVRPAVKPSRESSRRTKVLVWGAVGVLTVAGLAALGSAPVTGVLYLLAAGAALIAGPNPLDVRTRLNIPTGRIMTAGLVTASVGLCMVGASMAPSANRPSTTAASTPTPTNTGAQASAPPSAAPAPAKVDRAAMMGAIDAAWERSDWPAAGKAAQDGLAAFPDDPEFKEKLFAARVNHGDSLVQRGQKPQAAKAYVAAAEVQPNAIVDDKIKALTPVPPTPTPAPEKAQARYVDPRELVADPKSFEGQNLMLQGKALNVAQNAEQRGLFGTTPEHTWIQLMATVRERSTTEPVVVEFRPRQMTVLKDECYRVYGTGGGTTKVTRTLTGATNDVPLINGYAVEKAPTGQFGQCTAP